MCWREGGCTAPWAALIAAWIFCTASGAPPLIQAWGGSVQLLVPPSLGLGVLYSSWCPLDSSLGGLHLPLLGWGGCTASGTPWSLHRVCTVPGAP